MKSNTNWVYVGNSYTIHTLLIHLHSYTYPGTKAGVFYCYTLNCIYSEALHFFILLRFITVYLPLFTCRNPLDTGLQYY